jgi:hypothetical protein
VPSPDWKREVQQTGEGGAVIQKVTWSGERADR